MKHTLLYIIMVTALLGISAQKSWADNLDIHHCQWDVTMNVETRLLDISYDGNVLFRGVKAVASDEDGNNYDSSSYPNITLARSEGEDALGSYVCYTYNCSGKGTTEMQHVFCFYNAHEYMVTQVALTDNNVISACRMSPLTATASSYPLPSGGDNRVLFVPFDNDKFRGYASNLWSNGQTTTSYEVTCMYDVMSRKAVCLGSVTHDTWKTGIQVSVSGNNRLRSLEAYGGIVDAQTNDVLPDEGPVITRHGSVRGTRVASPRIMVGCFDDWRVGLETYADANAAILPPKHWSKGTVFAWQSWGGMADKVNYAGACDVSDFFATELMPNGFKNENGECYMVLDSFWDNFSEDELRSFCQRCRANGQIPGIYFTPFSYWGKESSFQTVVPGTDGRYTYNDIILRANGKPRKASGAYCIDPTHPATKMLIRHKIAQFKEWGYAYLKLDFLNDGAVEADRFADDNVTTGIAAYNQGMRYLCEQVGDDMFLDLSIAPIFPHGYGHARRISCDAWGEINNSQYVLNSLNLGWWLERLYAYNDPDHIVIREQSEGANRIRYSTGAMTGTVLLGDNFALKGTCLGKQGYRDRIMHIATNAEINHVAQLGRSFRPIDGALATMFTRYEKGYGVDSRFYLDTDDALYVVLFNYDTAQAKQMDVNLSDLTTDMLDDHATELWSGQSCPINCNVLQTTVPAADVHFFCIKKIGAGISTAVASNHNSTNKFFCPQLGTLLIADNDHLSTVSAISIK